MSATWVTKYGVRRVRVELPTLDDALYAAEGLTSDRGEQIRIAAELMQVPVEQVRAEAERIIKNRANTIERTSSSRSMPGSRPSGPIVVERRAPRRLVARAK